jgi:hypothetical protein
MPVGSPGMGAGGKKEPYSVLLFDSEGNTQIYESR